MQGGSTCLPALSRLNVGRKGAAAFSTCTVAACWLWWSAAVRRRWVWCERVTTLYWRSCKCCSTTRCMFGPSRWCEDTSCSIGVPQTSPTPTWTLRLTCSTNTNVSFCSLHYISTRLLDATGKSTEVGWRRDRRPTSVLCLQCFDIVAVRRQEEHPACKNWVMRCWCVFCPEWGADCLHKVHCHPEPHHLSLHLNPDWFYLSGSGSSRLSCHADRSRASFPT